MTTRRLARIVSGCTFLAVTATPALAMAAEEASTAAADPIATAGRALGAGIAIGLSALGTGLAQSKIGAAGAGVLAERPEAFPQIIVLLALPELIVLFGFVIAFVVNAG